MNVGQLKELLGKYPDEMDVVYPLHSDYDWVTGPGVSVIKVVDKGFYLMGSHRTMSGENKLLEKEVLCISGS